MKFKDYSELPISKFLDYIMYCEETQNKISKKIMFLSIIYDKPYDEFMKMDLEEFLQYQIPEDFDESKLESTVEVVDEVYKFNYFGKNYIIDTKITNWNVGKFADIETIEMPSVSKNIKDKIINIFSVLLQEEGMSYNSSDFINRVPFVENLPTSIVYGIASEIIKKKIQLKNYFQESIQLENKALQMMENLKESLK